MSGIKKSPWGLSLLACFEGAEGSEDVHALFEHPRDLPNDWPASSSLFGFAEGAPEGKVCVVLANKTGAALVFEPNAPDRYKEHKTEEG